MGQFIYIAFPLRAETEEEVSNNLEFAKKACRYCALTGKVPFAPHLYFTQFLRDEVCVERLLGMKLGQCILPDCEELWVCGDTISEGMKSEITVANREGLPVKYISAEEIEAFLHSNSEVPAAAEA